MASYTTSFGVYDCSTSGRELFQCAKSSFSNKILSASEAQLSAVQAISCSVDQIRLVWVARIVSEPAQTRPLWAVGFTSVSGSHQFDLRPTSDPPAHSSPIPKGRLGPLPTSPPQTNIDRCTLELALKSVFFWKILSGPNGLNVTVYRQIERETDRIMLMVLEIYWAI